MSDTPVNDINLGPISGNILNENSELVNVVDVLGGGVPISDRQYDIAQYAPHSGRILGSDGREYSLADLLQNTGGGTAGLSAYQIAVRNGFTGTETEWLESLKGAPGEPDTTVSVREVSGFQPDGEGRVALGVLPVLTITPNDDGSLTLPEDAGYGGMLTLASMVGVSTDEDAPSGTAPILTASPLNLAPSIFTTGRNGSCTQRTVNEGVIFTVTGAYGGMQLSIRQAMEAGKTYTASVDILSATGNGGNALSLRAYNLTKSMYMTSDVPIPSGWDGSRRRVSITFQTSESRYVAGDNVILWLICGGTFQAPNFEFLVADTIMVSDAGRTQYIPPAEKIQLTLPVLYTSEDSKWRDEYADGVIRRYVNAQGYAQLPQYETAEYRMPLDYRYTYRITNYAPEMRASFSIPRKVILSGLDEANARLDASDAGIAELRDQDERFETKLGAVFDNSFRVVEQVEEKMDLVPIISSYWGHTTSTFSGWGGAIGPARNFNAIVLRIRNRSGNELPVTSIRAVVKVFDKAGAALADVTRTDFHIQPGEASEIIFALDKMIENAEGNQLWAGYWCNRLIDEWFGGTGINLNAPAYGKTTYTTNGSLTANMTDIHDPTLTNVSKPYLHAARISSLYQPTKGFVAALPEPVPTPYYAPVRVILPKRFDCVAGDTFQLFYRGVVEAVNPYQYDIRIQYTGQNGRNYPRYFQLLPQASDIGEHTLTITVQSNDGVALGTATTAIRVNAVPAASPASPVNVLCIGDSLTTGGIWVKEMARRLLETGGAPAGHGLTNINFIGTVGSADVKWEGYGGWSWNSYLAANGNPFWNATTGQVDFVNYCQVYGFAGIDHVFTLLTWNGMGPYRATATDHGALIASAKQLIDRIHAQYPTAKIHVMGIQVPSLNGGMGENYGAGGGAYSEAYGNVRTVFGLNLAYQALADETAYSGFVDFVNISGQFDSENNMPDSAAPVNTRSTKTETRGTNGVHPSEAGYLQIADAAYRRFVSLV